ncbi:hypothetical protein ScPMuIL_005821 [Solemya velum]
MFSENSCGSNAFNMICEVQGTETRIILTEDEVSIYFTHSTQTVPLSHILAVELKNEDGQTETQTTLCLHYAQPGSQCRLYKQQLSIMGQRDECEFFQKQISNSIKKSSRPKRLLIFVNPNSGKKRAMKIFNKYAAPLFQICGIQSEMIVTSRPKQPTEKLQACNLVGMDGIVTVGGDGLFCECLNALLIRAQKDAGRDYDDPDVTLRRPSLPIGIIPAGSGDVMAQYLHGTRDATTAVLKILLGDVVAMNSVGVYENKLTSYSGLILGFGLFGDMMKDCEKYRWMGPARYNIIPLGTILKRRTVDIDFEYLPADSKGTIQAGRRHFRRQFSAPGFRNVPPTPARQNSTPECIKISTTTKGWKKTDGRVYAVDTYAVSLGPEAGKLKPHFGDNAMSAILTDKCKLSKHMAQLTKLQKHQPDCYNYSFIRHFRVMAYRVRLLHARTKTTEDGSRLVHKKHYFNCDGEAIQLTRPEFEVSTFCIPDYTESVYICLEASYTEKAHESSCYTKNMLWVI